MRSRTLMAGTAVAALLLASACGSSDDGGSGGGSDSSGSSADGDRVGDLPLPELTSEISDAATASAEAAGEPVELPAKTIGYISYGEAIPISARLTQGMQNAAAAAGWDLEVCDGQSTPQGQLTCATNFVNEGVDAILTNGMPQSSIAPALTQADAAGIPVINVGGYIGQEDLFDGSIYPDEAGFGEVMGDWLVDKLPDGGPIATQTFQADFVIQRLEGLDTALEGSDVTIGDTFDADAANLIPGAQQSVSSSFNGNPDLQAYYMTFSGSEIGAAQAMQVLRPGAQFPERPLITTFYANLPTIDLIRSGQVDAAAENSHEWIAWVAMDQLAEFFARDTAISSEPRPDYGTDLDFWRFFVVDAENLPDEGELATPPVDFEGFFTTKWSTEFTNLSQ
ncbi:sugar ABC transporter substrate-binding protein [Blastococcus sp. URHD0036]|uniref:sugar ABC transporter substrate-binding protein n=1 Tax=Blastococcus sp. URHD0036 TaxID=1380356 RepID=UPI0009DEEE1A|nr:sugar ABC transporter substrate-binding protein [Blastococcus sp. URHD0036]